MITVPWWAKAAALAALAAGSYWWGASNAGTECALAAATRDVEAYGAQSVMQARVDTADQALAEKQALILQGVAVETIKYKVVYRDRIQNPAAARCVVDSGLLELYRSAYGFTVSGG
ncbi:hypothetical protein D3C77_433610 [compost metagenome]